MVALSTRLAEAARQAKADVIACACVLCHRNLDTRQDLAERLPVLYITELIGLSIGLPGVDRWLSKHAVDPRPVLQGRGLCEGHGLPSHVEGEWLRQARQNDTALKTGVASWRRAGPWLPVAGPFLRPLMRGGEQSDVDSFNTLDATAGRPLLPGQS